MPVYSSLSSSYPSHLNDQDVTSLPLDYSSSSSPSSHHSSILDENKSNQPDLWALQLRNCALGSEDEWMQPYGYDFAYSALDDDFISTTAHSDLPQIYGDGAYPQAFPPGFPPQPSQLPVGSHRRLPSSSSVASGAVDSPYSRTSSIPNQQYPSTYTQPTGFPNPQPSGWTWDSQSPISGAQHLPTPTGTPTSDQYSHLVYGQVPRRTKQLTEEQQAARVRAHMSFRQSLNQQWKPNTYAQSPLQAQHSLAEMPRTPQTVNGDDADGQQYGAGENFLELHLGWCNDELLKGDCAVATTVPKLGRTVSDARADELYNPYNLNPTYGDLSTMAPRPQNPNFLQPQPPVLQERLTAANKARSSSPSSPSGHASPFRNSPYGGSSDFNTQGVSQAPATMPDYGPIGSHPITSSQQNHKRVKQENEEPTTVSPKDAFPEQSVPKQEESYTSLFPEPNQPLQYAPYNAPAQDVGNLTSMPPVSWGYQATSMPPHAQLDTKQENASQEPQYGPIYANVSSSGNANYLPPHLASMETTKSEESDQMESSTDSGAERPSDTSASSARYTCPFKYPDGTYCHERFDDSAQLARHKKEHTRSSGIGKDDPCAPKMSQAGPHFCQRLNPNGERCGKEFTRPYDLTRHEETLHGNRKKVRCPHCSDERLFSRGDALTRHLRVVHANLPQVAGKQRRRRSGGL